jgi:uncharacterized membrane protein YfcA
MSRMRRDTFRVTLSAVVLIGGAMRFSGYASYGVLRGIDLTLLAIGLPLVVAGSWLVDRLAHRVCAQPFSRSVGALVLLNGVALLRK